MNRNLRRLSCAMACLLASNWVGGVNAQEDGSVSLPAVATQEHIQGELGGEARFGEPEMLFVGEKPLNTEAKQMYPSPAIFDIDHDGRDELIVGDIFGSLNVYENKNESGQGDPVWSACEKLESVDGKAIKVSNW